MPTATSFLADAIKDAWTAPFRGSIAEFASKLVLGQGYAVKGTFDPDSARHILAVLEAVRDPKVRLVSVQAAVQTLKSLIADIVTAYWILHDPGDMLFLLEDDPKAKLYADGRLMAMLRGIPEIARLLEGVPTHEKTKTKIRFSNMNLVVAGLNEGNVQSISYRYIILDESWMSRASGLIRQAIYRTTQYPDTKKILLLGQGGICDEDADTEHKSTNQNELHYRCPFCGFHQPFDLSRLRGQDHPKPELRGTYSGLSWDKNETTRPGGRWNWEAVGCSAHLRCYQCDARIEDRPSVRRQLCESFSHRPTNPGAPKELVGFHWPAPTSPRIKLGALAVRYLKAKVAADELGYRLPLQEFYQKDWGLTWSADTADEHRAVVHEPYDVRSDWPEEAHRCLIADCQRDLAKFYYSVFSFSMAGEARELARGKAGSYDELAAIQKEHCVRDQMTFLDCGFRMSDVLRECVKRGHVGKVKIGKRTVDVWLCWTGLKGSGQELFVRIHPKTKLKEWRIYSERKFYDVNAGKSERGHRAVWHEWSNLGAKDLLKPRRDGEPDLPKLRTLPDDLPSTDPESHFAQMRSERREEKFANGKKSARWVLVKESRANHWWDVASMLMVVMAICGVIGAPEVEPEAGTE